MKCSAARFFALRWTSPCASPSALTRAACTWRASASASSNCSSAASAFARLARLRAAPPPHPPAARAAHTTEAGPPRPPRRAHPTTAHRARCHNPDAIEVMVDRSVGRSQESTPNASSSRGNGERANARRTCAVCVGRRHRARRGARRRPLGSAVRPPSCGRAARARSQASPDPIAGKVASIDAWWWGRSFGCARLARTSPRAALTPPALPTALGIATPRDNTRRAPRSRSCPGATNRARSAAR